MTRPLLIDICCCAGGASVGYHRAGFDVIGVDITPQPRYPFEFHQADGIGVLRELVATGEVFGRRPAAVHTSWPCQKFSAMTQCRPGLADEYPDLITEGRELLVATGLPYVIENVPGSPVRPDLILCGVMFGRELYRHRLFESNVPLTRIPSPPLASHVQAKPCGWPHLVPASRAGHWKPGTVMSVAGNVGGVAHARQIMGMDWTNRRELGEAIPPYFTEHIGADLLAALDLEAAA